MVASVLVAKYARHLPLYRQAQMLLSQSIAIERATLAFWVGYAAAELKPLYLRLRELDLPDQLQGHDEPSTQAVQFGPKMARHLTSVTGAQDSKIALP